MVKKDWWGFNISEGVYLQSMPHATVPLAFPARKAAQRSQIAGREPALALPPPPPVLGGSLWWLDELLANLPSFHKAGQAA